MSNIDTAKEILESHLEELTTQRKLVSRAIAALDNPDDADPAAAALALKAMSSAMTEQETVSLLNAEFADATGYKLDAGTATDRQHLTVT